MPKKKWGKVERKLKARASRAGYSGERWRRYVYGTLMKLGAIKGRGRRK